MCNPAFDQEISEALPQSVGVLPAQLLHLAHLHARGDPGAWFGGAPGQRAGERWSEVALDGEPLGMRSSWLSYTMAPAETTVVETVSGGWPQVLSGPEMLLEAD
jgi:hypothetical protein